MTDWFRSWHGAPTDPKWRTVARRANARPGDVAAVAWVLFDRASQASERGCVEGYDTEVIADALGYEVEEVERIIAAMIDKGVIVDGRLSAWEKYQPKREREQDDSSARVKAFRERQAAVTPCNATERHETPRVETDTEPEEPSLRSGSARAARSDARKVSPGKGTRLPPDWQPSEADVEYAISRGVPRDKVPVIAEEFRNYWTARPGKDGVKLDWPATWRNRVLQVCEHKGWTPPGEPKAQAPPAENGTTWITEDDPRWGSVASRWQAERGKPLDPRGSRHRPGQGADVPSDWLVPH